VLQELCARRIAAAKGVEDLVAATAFVAVVQGWINIF
jgi:hypothetical protein